MVGKGFALLLLVGLVSSESISYESCICSTGCDCADTVGCSCPFSSAKDGICAEQDEACLEWSVVVCYEEQDLSLSPRIEGAECTSQPDGNGFRGRCLKISRDGKQSDETRCAREHYWQCRELAIGDTCDDAGGKCGKPSGTDDTSLLYCMAPQEHACLDKSNGDACDILYTGREWTSFPKEHFSQSVCSQSVCLDVELGACYSKAEGDACSYFILDDEEECDGERVRGVCSGQVYYDLYKKQVQGGSCAEALAESRPCEGGQEEEVGVLQDTSQQLGGSGAVLSCPLSVQVVVAAAATVLTGTLARDTSL